MGRRFQLISDGGFTGDLVQTRLQLRRGGAEGVLSSAEARFCATCRHWLPSLTGGMVLGSTSLIAESVRYPTASKIAKTNIINTILIAPLLAFWCVSLMGDPTSREPKGSGRSN